MGPQFSDASFVTGRALISGGIITLHKSNIVKFVTGPRKERIEGESGETSI